MANLKNRSNASEWFSNYHQHKPEDRPQKFRKRVFNLKNESDKWEFLSHANGGGKHWEVERGGCRFNKRGAGGVAHRRRFSVMKPDAERLKFEQLRRMRAEKFAVKREQELASQIKSHGYKDILSWREDKSVVKKRPIAEKRTVRKMTDRAGSIARMKAENRSTMRSSLSRFYFPTPPNERRQAVLQKAGLLSERQATVLGDGGTQAKMKSFGVQDAFTHAVYGGKALKSEWGIEQSKPIKPYSAPSWYGHRKTERATTAAVSYKKPDWFG